MSSTGNPQLPQPKPEAMSILLTKPPTGRTEYIVYMLKSWRVLHCPKFPFDDEYWREFISRAYDRNFYPAGISRQLAAILAIGNRKEQLKAVKVPTLVIHGYADPLVPVEGGIDTAEAVPEAELLIIEGLGHDIPLEVFSQIIDAIARHAV